LQRKKRFRPHEIFKEDKRYSKGKFMPDSPEFESSTKKSLFMRMKKTIIILISVLPQFLFAQGNAPKYSNEFLSIGLGARALGMSGAYVAAVSDATAGYWNPAGLQGITSKFQVSLMHSEYFAGIAKFDFGAIAARIDAKSVLGLTVIRFGVDDIPDTSELIDANGNVNYDRIKSFSAIDNAFLLSYAREIREDLRLGGTFKVIHRKVGDFAKAWGFGIDAGVRYSRGKWLMAAHLRDASSTFNAWSFNLSESQRNAFNATGNQIPENSLERTTPSLMVGAARNFALGEKFELLAELDLQTTFDGMRNTLIRDQTFSISPVLGMEASYRKIIFLRAGVGNFTSQINDAGTNRITTFQPNIGLGLKIKNFMIDYALTNIGASVFYSNVFSLRFDIQQAKAKS
jgi:hypothetical protein